MQEQNATTTTDMGIRKYLMAGMTPDGVFFWANWIGVIALGIGVVCACAIAVSGKIRDDRLKLALSQSQLQLVRLQMPRGFDPDKFNHAISGVPPAPVEVLYDQNSPDAYNLAGFIWGALFNAKWPVEPSTGAAPLPPPPSNVIPWGQMPWTMAAGASSWGISVLTSEKPDDAFKNASWRGLFEALGKSIDGQVFGQTPGQGSVRPGVLRVVIGPKHP